MAIFLTSVTILTTLARRLRASPCQGYHRRICVHLSLPIIASPASPTDTATVSEAPLMPGLAAVLSGKINVFPLHHP